MCIEHVHRRYPHVDLTRRRRYMNIQHGGSIRLVNVHGEHAGMLVLLNLGSDLAILVLCGPVVCARRVGGPLPLPPPPLAVSSWCF